MVDLNKVMMSSDYQFNVLNASCLLFSELETCAHGSDLGEKYGYLSSRMSQILL